MSTTIVKTITLRNDNTLIDKVNQEIPVESIIHCLGALFKVTNSGLSHVVGNIGDDTYFTDPKYFHQLNELAFSEQPDVTSTPDAAPHKEGLLASAYRLMTAPFLMKTPQNVTTRNRKRTSSPSKVVHINEIAGLATQAENYNDSMKVPPPDQMFLLHARCEKSIAEEVQFYFKTYKEFVTCGNQKLKAVISALNATNEGCHNDLRIKYPGFMLEPPVVDINKLVMVIQSVYPMQVLQYSLGATKKEESAASNTAITVSEDINNVGLFLHKGKDQVGLFPSNSSPKYPNKSNEHLGNLDTDQSVEEINEEINE